MDHADRVFIIVSDGSSAAHAKVAVSWRRSVNLNGLDPNAATWRDMPDHTRLRSHQEASERLM